MKKRNVFFVIPLFCFASVFGCSVNPSEINPDFARNFARNITYAQDPRTDLCFAFVASRKTGDTDQNGLGMSVVPCERVNHLLVK
ncbi:MAG: hypothetical protein V1867_03580 [Candidatus Falkowbacteria bacterium]